MGRTERGDRTATQGTSAEVDRHEDPRHELEEKELDKVYLDPADARRTSRQSAGIAQSLRAAVAPMALPSLRPEFPRATTSPIR